LDWGLNEYEDVLDWLADLRRVPYSPQLGNLIKAIAKLGAELAAIDLVAGADSGNESPPVTNTNTPATAASAVLPDDDGEEDEPANTSFEKAVAIERAAEIKLSAGAGLIEEGWQENKPVVCPVRLNLSTLPDSLCSAIFAQVRLVFAYAV
jgi:hypothetical protein